MSQTKMAHELSDAELAEALRQCEAVKIQERALRAEAMRRAEKNPTCLPGWALRDRRATRKWDSAPEVIDALRSAGLASDYVLETVLSPAQMERSLKHDPDLQAYWSQLKAHIVQESSGKTLVQTETAAPADNPFEDDDEDSDKIFV